MIQEAQMIKAKAEMTESYDKGLGSENELASKIARQFGVSEVALRSWNRRRRNRQPLKPRPIKLAPVLEEYLCNMILAFAKYFNPLTREDVRDLAAYLYKYQSSKVETFSDGWVDTFLERHSEIVRQGITKKSHKKTVLNGLGELVFNWCIETEKTLSGLALQPELVFNIDETKATSSKLAYRGIGSAKSSELHMQNASYNSLYTLVSCICADGSTLFLVFIFKSSNSQKSPFKPFYVPVREKTRTSRQKTSIPIFYATTPGGYMNGDLWKEVMMKFVELVGLRQGIGRQKQAVLFLDGCSSHLKDFTTSELSQKNITPIYFAPNSSLVCQPADGAVFATYKSKQAKLSREADLRGLIYGTEPSDNIVSLCIKAYEESATKKVVLASFRDRGCWPFDKVKMMTNVCKLTGGVQCFEVSQEVQTSFITLDLFQKHASDLKESAVQERVIMTESNTLIAQEGLSPAPKKRKKPTKSKKGNRSPNKPLKKKAKIVENPIVPQVPPSVAAEVPLATLPAAEPPADLPNFCSDCGKLISSSIPNIPCPHCPTFKLCFKCNFNGQALAKHNLAQNHTENRLARRRSTAPVPGQFVPQEPSEQMEAPNCS